MEFDMDMTMENYLKADLKGQVAVVMGATAGVGLPCAHALAHSGATVVVVSIDQEGMEKTVADIKAGGGDAIYMYADLLDYQSVKTMIDAVVEKYGKIDILVNSSGGSASIKKQDGTFNNIAQPFIDLDPEDYETCFKRFCFVKLYGIRAALPHMRERGYGKIINITSDAGRTPTPKESMIGGGSAAVILMTKTIAKECSRWGICINTIGVTLVPDTEANAKVLASDVANVFAKVISNAKLGLPSRKELASAVVFFASHDTDHVTGMTLSCNGGVSFPG